MLLIYSTTNNGCRDGVAVNCELNGVATELDATKADVDASAAKDELVAYDLS